ncbi:hypothetical protein P167DRAFT_561569 [Morchella conica CCBAS932]|uniref:Nucleic acid-binding protein n=2 Tax=Morchella sect. Distantes TaxID=1051054 RepID=A0A3N4L2Z0_9PEZI|nr:hypothetical protein P167DRAFT_561569 [Morchella conica CCBAS932]
MMTETSPPPSSYRTAEEGSFAGDLPDSSAASGDSVTRVSSGRTILLLGAPRASTLRNLPLIDFDSDDNNKEDLPAFWGQTSGNVDHVTSTSLPIPSATEHPAVWRILPLKRKYLHTGFSQRPEVHTPTHLRREEFSQDYNSSIDPSSTTSTNGDDDLNRSFAVHNMPSSPVAGPSDLEASFTSTAAASSFSSITETPAPPPMLSIIPSMALTNLQNLPTASYLKSIVPQTMSISAIVGIIQIFEPRTFTTKRYGTQLTIQTLLVGDETSAGFKLDLWLPNGKLTSAGEAFVATVDSLRVGDIILVQNMALGFWDNRVNGATLRKDRTRIELIYRVNYSGSRERQQWRAVDLERVSEDRSGVEKVKRVLEYVRNFVERPAKKIKKKPVEVYEEEEDT